MKRFLPVVLGLLALLPGPAPACSLCAGMASKQTFRREMEEAKVVLYGTLTNPRFDNSPGAMPGSGFTDFHVARTLKTDPAAGEVKSLTLPRYLPVLDAKDPPRFVIYCNLTDGKLKAVGGRSVRSDAALQYLQGALALPVKDRTKALLYFFNYLDHADETVALDAFLEFARSTDEEVGQVARHLPPDRLRRLLLDPKTAPERLGLYAFLLGASGGEQDAELLRKLIEAPTERTVSALDGLLCGYIHLRPREGWDLTVKLLGDSKKPFSQRFAVSRVLRFYQGWKPAETRAQVLRGLDVMLPDGEVADLAVEDLRRWKTWDLTAKVLAQYDKPTHDSPIVRRAIIRYALVCPQPEARRFVDELRRRDPDLIRDLEEGLQIEKQ
ncbi:MAG: hypothetical protein L0Z62_42290 [Gemmataceae bacterium]|nr:hypothetical protein [Gemmataceae bacterium]